VLRSIRKFIGQNAAAFLFGVAVAGVALVIGGAWLGSTDPQGRNAWRDSESLALATVGGALLAGVVVGMLVDQITRHKLSRDTGERWLWALLGEDTPPQLRKRAKEVISHGQAHLNVSFECTMDWIDDPDGRILRLRIRVITDGINHSRSERYAPIGPAWSMPSVRGRRTKYVKWAFEALDQHGTMAPRRLEADAALIEKFTHEMPPGPKDFEPDGSAFIYQGQLLDELADKAGLSSEQRKAGPGERFRLERELEMFLDPSDFFPFFVLVPTVRLEFYFSGDACGELAIKARANGTQVEQHLDERGKKNFRLPDALLPGHVVILSWMPLPKAQVDVPEESQAAVVPG
jgi:hypothetical protein